MRFSYIMNNWDILIKSLAFLFGSTVFADISSNCTNTVFEIAHKSMISMSIAIIAIHFNNEIYFHNFTSI